MLMIGRENTNKLMPNVLLLHDLDNLCSKEYCFIETTINLTNNVLNQLRGIKILLTRQYYSFNFHWFWWNVALILKAEYWWLRLRSKIEPYIFLWCCKNFVNFEPSIFSKSAVFKKYPTYITLIQWNGEWVIE